MSEEPDMDELKGETCAFCNKNTLTLRQMEREVPYFGNLILFSMQCENPECAYRKSDVEAEQPKGKVKQTLEVNEEEDLKARVVKSSTATVKVPRVGNIEPGEASNGYVTNIEGILNRLKVQIEKARDLSEDDSEKKKAKNLIKKLSRVMQGRDKIKVTLEDPEGNSSIISEKIESK